ncbi:MAG: hypothetical protein LBH61_03365 [Dysgonamonadaceae bacterium]|jgi:hypothetical protein|nr:hypothetical protein [Dysgonamonadaceae bacterium]
MNKFSFQMLLAAVLLPALSFTSCNNGFENYSTRPGDRLSFSTDTVAFDTIITAVRTPFRLFKVYNTHSKALLISSVSLEGGANSPFKINVDGQTGATFSNVEIRGKDSLFVFVDARPAKNGSYTPEYVSDRVVFVTNGGTQKVVLEASTQDAVLWRGVTIASDSLLSNRQPFVVYDSLVIDEGVTVELEAGTLFYMHRDAEIIVKGTLKANGTQEQPVVVRGDRFDFMTNVPYDLIPGQWGGIRFESSSYGNELNNARIRNGTYGMDFKRSDPARSKMKMKNVVLTNFKGVLVRALNCRIEAVNCEFSNAKDALLHLTGGQYRFTHCTIANHYFGGIESGWGSTNNETVRLLAGYLNEESGEAEYYPLTKADFLNSIIWGKGSGSGIFIESINGVAASNYFRNCVIPNKDASNDDKQDPDATVIDCLIAVDPKFRQPSPDDFVYDFRLDSLSPARNKALPEFAVPIPHDLNGIGRLDDEAPDIGAYEWAAGKE